MTSNKLLIIGIIITAFFTTGLFFTNFLPEINQELNDESYSKNNQSQIDNSDISLESLGVSQVCLQEWEKANDYCQQFAVDECFQKTYDVSNYFNYPLQCEWVDQHVQRSYCQAQAVCD